MTRFRQQVAGRFLRALYPAVYWSAWHWRSLLGRTTCFIAVTGSFGKTTVKECLSGILAKRHRTFKSHRTQNASTLLALNILRVRPWHRFAVIETATSRPGQMHPAARLVRPDIAVITGVGDAHANSYRSMEEIANEKMELLRWIRPGGTAILNGDEPLLSTASDRGRFRILHFGSRPEFDLCGSEVRAQWPGRLELVVQEPGSSFPLATRLVGTHWVPSVLAAILAARTCGLTLSACVQTVESVKPFPARMQPVRLPGGAVVIRDEYNSAEDSYRESFAFFEQARASRKIVVISDFDSRKKRRRRLHQLGRQAAAIADLLVFVGESAEHSRNAAIKSGIDPEAAVCFTTPRDAAVWLDGKLGPGDLLLLKGRSCDHLSRLIFAQVGEVKCWKPTCSKRYLCDICWELGMPEDELAQIEPL